MYFRVMFAGEIVHPAKDRQVRIDFVFGRDVEEAKILDVEIRSAEIDLLTRIDELRFNRRPEFLAPQVRT